MNFDSPPRSSTDAWATSSESKAPKRQPLRRIGKRVANLAAGTKFKVKFDYAHRPVGEYKPDYITRQGVVVRNAHITSLAYKSWHKVPQEMKQKMMDAVLETHMKILLKWMRGRNMPKLFCTQHGLTKKFLHTTMPEEPQPVNTLAPAPETPKPSVPGRKQAKKVTKKHKKRK